IDINVANLFLWLVDAIVSLMLFVRGAELIVRDRNLRRQFLRRDYKVSKVQCRSVAAIFIFYLFVRNGDAGRYECFQISERQLIAELLFEAFHVAGLGNSYLPVALRVF